MQSRPFVIGPYNTSSLNSNNGVVTVAGQKYAGVMLTPDNNMFGFSIKPQLRQQIGTGDPTQGYLSNTGAGPAVSWPSCPLPPGLMPLLCQITFLDNTVEIVEVVDSRQWLFDRPMKSIAVGINLPMLGISVPGSAPTPHSSYLAQSYAQSLGGAAFGMAYRITYTGKTEIIQTPFDQYNGIIPLWQYTGKTNYLDSILREQPPPLMYNPINLFGVTDTVHLTGANYPVGPIYILEEYEALRISLTAANAVDVQIWSTDGDGLTGGWTFNEDIPAAAWNQGVQGSISGATYVFERTCQFANEWLYFIAPGSASVVTVEGEAIFKLA
jgi:hypothetical protein